MRATALIPFIMHLLSSNLILIIFPFSLLQSSYHTSVLCILRCTCHSSSAAEFGRAAPFNQWRIWPCFPIANSLSFMKATSIITISENEKGRVFHVPDWTVQRERKYRKYFSHPYGTSSLHVLVRKAVWMLSHPLSTQLQHSVALHRWLRFFSGFRSYLECQTASDLFF